MGQDGILHFHLQHLLPIQLTSMYSCLQLHAFAVSELADILTISFKVTLMSDIQITGIFHMPNALQSNMSNASLTQSFTFTLNTFEFEH